MPIQSVGDREVFYKINGQGEPLLMVAGYGCDHREFNGLAEQLTPYFTVIRFDNRGVGQTRDNDSGPITVDQLAQDTFALADYLGLANFHLMGQSMGGTIAQTMAHWQPNRINKLVITCSVAKWSTATVWVFENLLAMAKAGVAFDHLFNAMMPWCFGSNFLSDSDRVEAFRHIKKTNPYPQSLLDCERQLHALMTFDSRTWLDQILVPTLVVGAEQDLISLPGELAYLASALPNAELAMLPGGHSMPIHSPAVLADKICAFLTSGKQFGDRF